MTQPTSLLPHLVSYLTTLFVGGVEVHRLQSFASSLSAAIENRCCGHWYEHDPERGSAFRSIARVPSSLDFIVIDAMVSAGFSHEEAGYAYRAWPSEFTLWIDPGCVSVRDSIAPARTICGQLPQSLASQWAPTTPPRKYLPRPSHAVAIVRPPSTSPPSSSSSPLSSLDDTTSDDGLDGKSVSSSESYQSSQYYMENSPPRFNQVWNMQQGQVFEKPPRTRRRRGQGGMKSAQTAAAFAASYGRMPEYLPRLV